MESIAIASFVAHCLDWLGGLRDTGRIVGDVVSPASDESTWDVLGEIPLLPNL